MTVTLCLSCSLGLLNRRPTLLDAGFLYCILSASSLGPKLHRGFRGPLRSGVAFPTTSRLQLSGTPTVWNSTGNSTGSSNSTELYNRSTPTRSLKLNSSSNGNNCHAVQRSLSSGESVYESIMGFFSLSHFVSQFPPTRFLLLIAIGMCHFLPVHHLEWNFELGQKVKIQHMASRQLYICIHLHGHTHIDTGHKHSHLPV